MRTRRTKIWAAVAATAVAATSLPIAAANPVQAAGPTVFINEIHYDNAGTDSGEGFEIAGPAGTDLTDWSVVLYNGNGGATYNNTIGLSGALADQQAGFGTAAFGLPSNGLQNGSPDGLALIDPDQNVVEFLSYEGSFVAVGGPADGIRSTDIGVEELGTTLVGHSLQLVGTGSMGGDFTWAEAQTNTFGAVNTGQTFEGGEPPAPNAPVINEFSASTAGTDVEYVEILGDPATDYSNLTVIEIEGDSGSNTGTIDEVIPVGTTDDAGFWLASLAPNTLENGSITLLLVDGFTGALGDDLDTDDDGTPDVTPWASVVDGIAVNDGDAGDQTYAVTLAEGYDGLSFSPGGASRIPDGTDTDTTDDWVRNDFSLAGIPGNDGTPEAGEAFNTPGAPNAAVVVEPTTPTLVINEIDYDQPGTDAAEFVELLNNGSEPVDLAGIVLELVNGNNGSIYNTIALPEAPLAAGDTFVVCANAATVANCDLDSSPDTDFLQNGAPDAVGLRDAAGNLIDALSYEGDVPGYTEGSGAAGDSGATEAVDLGLSRCPAGSDTNDNSVDFLTDRPISPGATNSCGDEPNPCPGSVAIADVQGPGDITPLDGQTVTIRGIVTAVFRDEIVVQDGDGARSGVVVFSPDNTGAVGDDVCVTGVASERFEQTQVGGNDNPAADVAVISSGNALPAPIVLSTADVNNEDFEGVFVRVENATVANADLGFGEFSVDDGSGAVRVDDLGAATYNPTLDDLLEFVQGPLYFSFDNYKIEPRDDADIGVTVVPEVCGDPATFIHEIQGDGFVSPLVRQAVSIEGVVVGDFQDGDGDLSDLNGFFVQEEDGQIDGDPVTSEGIFVFDDSNPAVDVAVGDLVRVSGTVDEFFGMTQIENVSVLACDGAVDLPAPTIVTLPYESEAELEAVEGMYVTLPQSLAIVEFFNFDQFGEIVVATDRLFQPTAVFEPGSDEAAALADLNDRSKITIDDGRTARNPDPAIHPNGDEFTLDNRFRGGDLVTNATGVLNYSFGLYRVQPTEGADYESVNPRTEPESVGGNVTVASFNVLNYFNTIDNAGPICGPELNQGCRGADTEEERERQLAKIVAAIAEIDADVVGIIEVENTAGVEALADIVDGLNALLGEGTYDYLDTGLVGDDAIKVGFIYQPGAVSLVGDFAVLDTPEFVSPNTPDPKNRAALAQTFQDNETGGVFTVAVNHLKSKGSECGPGDDDPEAGSCNLTRTLAAQELANWLATDPTDSGDADVLIIGDLNAYDKEDPIDALEAEGYTDLVDVYQGEFAYSFVFSGELGYLDYAMANVSLAAQVTGATIWHSNADEPDILDYDTSFKKDAQDALYEPNAFRASDHDAVIVGLEVCDAIAPEIELTLSRTTLGPPNGKYREVDATIVVGDNFDAVGDLEVRLVSAVSDEPDNGDDDGNTVDDIVAVDDDSFLIRAERSGSGDGRTYTITYEVEDSCGNVATASATVEVPLDRGGQQGDKPGKGNNKFR